MNETLTYIKDNKDQFLKQLVDFLSIPSISAQKEHNLDTKEAAEWLKNNLTEIGLENVKIMDTGGHPIVYADYLHSEGKPIALIYGHYDVQAVDPINEWESDPFKPEVRNGNLYGRGTADDKGQLFTHIKAIEAILKTKGSLPINVKFLLEGEEEVGGPNLDSFIEKNQELLKADFCIISDSHALSPTQPIIDYGLRGIVYAELNLSVMTKDVHSGTFGGNVPNAAFELMKILSQLKNQETQEVLVPGFYENVRILTEAEKEELKRSPFTTESMLAETGAKKIIGVEGFNVAEREGARPTLDVNGMLSGYAGEGAKTIIPAKATAKVSMRLVPSQTAKEIEQKFLDFIKEITPEYVTIDAKILSSGEPILMDIGSDYFEKAKSALESTFGNTPIFALGGGSIPVTATIKSVLGIDSILMGFGLPDDGLHSPNEKLNVEMFYKGIETSARFLLEFEA